VKSSRDAIETFLAQPALAIAGVSRSGKKFGNVILRELRAKGHRIYPLHPTAAAIDGQRCYRYFSDLPERIGGLVVCLSPPHSVDVVRDAAAAGITNVWLQQGADSPYLVHLCGELGLNVVAGECILMFASPKGIHRVHRMLRGAVGRLPR
jgi:uncharacterized protein